jgi:hypothetical protein
MEVLMAVYVDPLFNTEYAKNDPKSAWKWKESCHMTADTLDELHEMATAIGMRRSWYQPPKARHRIGHYDLVKTRRATAVRRGAIEVTKEQFIKKLYKPEVLEQLLRENNETH